MPIEPPDGHEEKLDISTIKSLVDRIKNYGQLLSPGARALLTRLLANEVVAATPSNRTAVTRIREALDYYFDKTEGGREEPYRLTVPDVDKTSDSKSHYRVVAVKNQLKLEPREEFWDPHCVGRPDDESISIVYTEPLFFWIEKDRTFVRFLDINWDEPIPVSEEVIVSAKERAGGRQLIDSFHYQPAGEIAARYQLLRWFRNYDVIGKKRMKLTPIASRECVTIPDADRRTIWDKNLIVLGNRRTNWLFRELQKIFVDRNKNLDTLVLEEDAITWHGSSIRW